MSTCLKCGEAIEAPFDSCWKCSQVAREPEVSTPLRLKSTDYIIAALIAYLMPLPAIFLQPSFDNPYAALLTPNPFEARAWLWMLVPAAVNFVVLLPFLKFPDWSRVVAFLLLFGWVWFFFSMDFKIK
jgi:hypothetical protein